MDKNVGSVDLEELKRAREELDRERGVETDPNMYNNYNPGREEETASAPDSAQTEDMTEQAEDMTPSTPEAETSAYTPETYSGEDEVRTDVSTDYDAATAETDESATDVTAEIESAEESVAEPETTPVESTEPAVSEIVNETASETADEPNYESAETLETDVSADTAESEQPTTVNDYSDLDVENNEVLQALFGDDFDSIKDTLIENTEIENEQRLEEENSQESTPNNDYEGETEAEEPSVESEETEVTESEPEVAETPASANGDNFSVKDEDYKQIINDDRTENGMRVTLPNIDQNDVKQEKNFDVYDNFAQFEVHYTPPEEPEEEEETQTDNDTSMVEGEIHDILFGSSTEEEQEGDEEQPQRRNYQTETKPNSPTQSVDMASYSANATESAVAETTSAIAEAENSVEETETTPEAEEITAQAEENTMSNIAPEKINDDEANSLENGVETEDNQEEIVEMAVPSSEEGSEQSDLTENEQPLTENEEVLTGTEPETLETEQQTEEISEETTENAVETEATQPETEVKEEVPTTAEEPAVAEIVTDDETNAQAGETTSTQETSQPEPVRNAEFDELPAHDYAEEDVITKTNESYISTTGVNYADLNKMYEESGSDAEKSEPKTPAKAEKLPEEEEKAPVEEENVSAEGETAEQPAAETTENAKTEASEVAQTETAEESDYSDNLISFTSVSEEEETSAESAEETETNAETEDVQENSAEIPQKTETSVQNEKESKSDQTEEDAPLKVFVAIPEYSYIDAVVDDRFKNSGKLTMMLGKKEDGEFEFSTIEKGYNIAVFGDTSSETYANLMNSLMLSLMLKNTSDEVKFLLCDAKDGKKLSGLSDNSFVVGKTVFADKDSILENLMTVSKDLEDRYKMLAKMRVKSVEEYNKIAEDIGTSILPYNVIVFSNFQNLIEFENEKEINALLFNLLKFGRIVGIYLIIGSSKPINNNEINYNLPARVALKTDDEVLSTSFVGNADAKYLEDDSDIIYSKIDNKQLHLKVAKISSNELKLIIQNIED